MNACHFSYAKAAVVILSLAVCFVFCPHLSLAQGGERQCQDAEALADDTPSAAGDCSYAENHPEVCEETNFAVTCPGNYTVYIQSTCDIGYKCEYCQACIWIFEGEESLGGCHTNECDAGQCKRSCGAIYYLSANVTYTMRVCLMDCPGLGGTCSDHCRAIGCVSIYNTPCPITQ